MPLEYFEPTSLDEALGVLRQGKGRYGLFAGGTDIVLQWRRRIRDCQGLVNVKQLPDIRSWCLEEGSGLSVGAAAPMREIETSPVVREHFPSLVDAIQVVGSVQLRNLATLGGNLCNASPAADTAPPLMVLGATVVFVDGSSPESLPLQKFFKGPGKSVLSPAGILLAVKAPEPKARTGDCFQRFTPRSAMDIAYASAASRVTLDKRGLIEDVAIALGAVAPTPIRAYRAEERLVGHEPTPELLAEAGAQSMQECQPIDDLRASATYRRALVRVLVQRTLTQALIRARRRAEVE